MQKHQVYTGLPDDVLSNWQHHAGAKHQVDPGLPDNVQSPQGLWHPLHGDRYKWQFFLSSLALSTFLSIYICIYPGRKLPSLYVSFLIYLSTWVIISTELSSIYQSIYLSPQIYVFIYLFMFLVFIYHFHKQHHVCRYELQCDGFWVGAYPQDELLRGDILPAVGSLCHRLLD